MTVHLLKSRFLILSAMFLTTAVVTAQNSKKALQKLQDDNKITSYSINEDRNSPFLIKMDGIDTQRAAKADAQSFIRQALQLDNNITLSQKNNTILKGGLEVEKFQEYYQGIKVEHGSYNVVSKDGHIQAIGLEHYDFSDTFNTKASLSEDAALQQAFNHVGATEYAWDMYSTMKMNESDSKKLAAIDEVIESVYPKGELVIVDDYSTKAVDMRLAYKFNVYAAEPLYRADIYVDAQNGKILLADMDIKHAGEINESIKESRKMSSFAMVQATGDLRYAGTRNFETTFVEATLTDPEKYVLLGTIMVDAINPSNGLLETLPIENETKSYDGVGGVPLSVGGAIPSYEITDGSSRPEESQLVSETADNMWTADEHYRARFDDPGETYPSENETSNDDTSLDAHWGSEIVLRYWADRHNRYSWDGQGTRITSFVHYGDAYDNAFYTNATMTYGDGSYQGGTNPNGSFAPLMSLDVAGHEIGHGVCDTTSGLVYARQSGGMNEGFSDIWAATVEAYVIEEIDPSLAARYLPYGIGEQIDERDGGIQPEDNDPGVRALRWMDDPKAAGDPDCLEGENWVATDSPNCNLANDQCGVHSNSGVLNKWYYLLVEGSGQAITPGRSKITADDEMNDNNMPYSVTGIGHRKAEQIAFGGEVLLSANATYAEMREMSILVAQQLYGQGSAEEQATTEAWFATCIGEPYVRPEGNVVRFNSDNPTSVQERNTSVGCETSRFYTYNINSVLVDEPTTITLNASNSTATLGEDFRLTNDTFVVSGSAVYSFDIEVFNDAIIEEGEMISLSYSYNGETFTQDIALVDDDIVPAVGSSVKELLPLQEFETSELPEGWDIVTLVDPGVNKWEFNGTGAAAGQAYVTDGTTDTPMYDGNGPGTALDGNTNTILMTPLINGLGLRDITVSFDYTAGGEDEAGTPLDYGELVYSFNGSDFFGVETFYGPGNTVEVGSFNDIIADVENSQFYIGFRWLNDQLLGTAYSFTVDNITISGSPALVATEEGSTVSHTVRKSNDIYFQDVATNNIIARIENGNTDDLGCVTTAITGSGTDTVTDEQGGFVRSSKVIQINADGIDASFANYDVTFYMTTEELANFTDINALQIVKVNNNDINATSQGNFVIAGGLVEDLRDTEGYATFRGNFTGFSSFAIVEPSVAGVNDLETSGVALYPSPVTRGNQINITTESLAIKSAKVFDIRGVQVLSQSFNGQNNVRLNTAALQTGFYFLTLNNDSNKTFKFIVK